MAIQPPSRSIADAAAVTESTARAIAKRTLRASIFGDPARNAACNAAIAEAGVDDPVPLYSEAEIARHVEMSWPLVARMIEAREIAADGEVGFGR